jgi:hypothetical protein
MRGAVAAAWLTFIGVWLLLVVNDEDAGPSAFAAAVIAVVVWLTLLLCG